MNKTKIEKWISDLEQSIAQPKFSGMEEYIRCRDLCMMLFLQLKEEIKTTVIENQEDEIYFFRNLKPRLVSRFFYYMKVMNIESRIPIGSTELKINYLKEEKNKLDNYFQRHRTFSHYINSNMTHLDHIYFTRGEHHIIHFGEYNYIEMDNEFSTSYDFILARLMANEDIHTYLEIQIQKLNRAIIPMEEVEPKLQWISSKTDMVELIYALHESGSIPEDISKIVHTFQLVFNIDLGEFYKTWSSIRIRKKDTTFYINRLKHHLERKMESYE